MYRYIGNKTAIIDPLLEILLADSDSGAVFADPMCGTASISAAIAEAGHKVIAADILTFPALHAEVRLRLNTAPKFEGIAKSYEEVIDHLNELTPIEDYFYREYSADGSPTGASKPRKYLSGANAARIDAVVAEIHDWESRDLLTQSELSLLRHDLILGVNRVANIAGTYGHFRSSFTRSSLAPFSIRPSSFNSWASPDNQVLIGTAEEIIPNLEFDVLYLDPPYMKRQYAANYHLLETIARGDKPTPSGESGLRDWWPQYSDFCSKRKVGAAFRAVLKAKNYKKAFVSYSEDGLLESSELVSLLSEFGDVRKYEIDHRRFRSNNSKLGEKLTEFVFEVVP